MKKTNTTLFGNAAKLPPSQPTKKSGKRIRRKQTTLQTYHRSKQGYQNVGKKIVNLNSSGSARRQPLELCQQWPSANLTEQKKHWEEREKRPPFVQEHILELRRQTRKQKKEHHRSESLQKKKRKPTAELTWRCQLYCIMQCKRHSKLVRRRRPSPTPPRDNRDRERYVQTGGKG